MRSCIFLAAAAGASVYFFTSNIVLAEQAAPEKKSSITIGVSLALTTAAAATYGTDSRNVLQFAADELAPNRIKFIFEDDRCSGREAVTAAHKLVDVDKVQYVIGPGCSGSTLAAAPIYEKAKVLTITPIASAPEISHAGEYIFRTWPSDAGAAALLGSYIAKHHRSIGMLTEDTDYCRGLSNALRSKVADQLTVSEETYLPETSDFRTLLLKLRTAGVEALFLNSQAEAGSLKMLSQIRAMGWNPPLYAAYFPGTKTFLESAGKSADGFIFVDPPSLEKVLGPRGAALLQKFEARYGKLSSIEVNFITSFEAFNALLQAIDSGQDPREFLLSHKFSGIIDSYRFDKFGDIVGVPFVLKSIREGQPVLLENAS